MIEAHARMYDAVKAADTVDADGDGVNAEVGVVYNLEPVVPDDPTNPTDVQAAKNADYLLNQAFLDGMGPGLLDANLDGQPVMRPDLANKLDFHRRQLLRAAHRAGRGRLVLSRRYPRF